MLLILSNSSKSSSNWICPVVWLGALSWWKMIFSIFSAKLGLFFPYGMHQIPTNNFRIIVWSAGTACLRSIPFLSINIINRSRYLCLLRWRCSGCFPHTGFALPLWIVIMEPCFICGNDSNSVEEFLLSISQPSKNFFRTRTSLLFFPQLLKVDVPNEQIPYAFLNCPIECGE